MPRAILGYLQGSGRISLVKIVEVCNVDHGKDTLRSGEIKEHLGQSFQRRPLVYNFYELHR